MKREEIAALARAYAEMQVDRVDCNSDEEYDYVINRWTEEVIPIYEFLADTHCIVPKSKVAQEYRNCMSLAENHPKPSERKIAKCVADELKAVFGKNTFEDKEEEL